jgi:nicotinamide mononucleotide transporter
MSAAEIIGTALGIVGVALMVRRHLWAFPVGLVQVTIFGWVCFEARLYSETALQLMFFAALAHGWWHWTHPGAGRRELPVGRLSVAGRLLAVAVVGLLWAAWGTIMHRWTDAVLPYVDALVFALSVVAQWLQARKLIENWPGWLLANTVAIGVFASRGLHLFAGLYGIFWLMALWGWREWHRARQHGENHA